MSLSGGVDDDLIVGGSQGDRLIGWGGDDTINGVDGIQGNDQLWGSNGTDTCTADPDDSITPLRDLSRPGLYCAFTQRFRIDPSALSRLSC